MVRCSAVFISVALALSPAVAQAPAPRPAPVVDNGEFMDLFLKTTYGELQQAMAKPPVDRKAWATIYQRAIQVAEMQNLLFFRDRPEVSGRALGGADRREPPERGGPRRGGAVRTPQHSESGLRWRPQEVRRGVGSLQCVSSRVRTRRADDQTVITGR
jgi:hypothetical protein